MLWKLPKSWRAYDPRYRQRQILGLCYIVLYDMVFWYYAMSCI